MQFFMLDTNTSEELPQANPPRSQTSRGGGSDDGKEDVEAGDDGGDEAVASVGQQQGGHEEDGQVAGGHLHTGSGIYQSLTLFFSDHVTEHIREPYCHLLQIPIFTDIINKMNAYLAG